MNQINRPSFNRGNLNTSACRLALAVTFSLLMLAGASPTFAATTNVSFGSFFFRPSNITIAEGDTVIWTHTNTDLSSHTVTGTGSEKICGSNLVPVSCSHTFQTAGSYPYICTVFGHAGLGMVGTVNVVAPAATPASLTNLVRLTNGQFRFTVNTTANRTNVVQGSTLLTPTNWVPLGSLVPTSNTFIFTDTNAPGFQFRFYRVVEP